MRHGDTGTFSQAKIAERVFRDHLNSLENYRDDELRKSISTVEIPHPGDTYHSECWHSTSTFSSQALALRLILCCTLGFLATGAIYSVLGDGLGIS
jgi:hypothetical protein